MNYYVNYEGPHQVRFSQGLNILTACRKATGILNLRAECIDYNPQGHIDSSLVVPEKLLEDVRNFPEYCIDDFKLTVITDEATLRQFFKLDIAIVWNREYGHRVDYVIARWRFEVDEFLTEWVEDGCPTEWCLEQQTCEATH